MRNIVEFPDQTPWRALAETPKVTERVFLVAQELLSIVDKNSDELTEEENIDFEALKAVLSELSLINFDLVSKINEAEKQGLINKTEKVIAISVFLTIQQIRPEIVNSKKDITEVNFFSSEILEKIYNSNLDQNIKDFLLKVISKIQNH
jgi:hypothetical protein